MPDKKLTAQQIDEDLKGMKTGEATEYIASLPQGELYDILERTPIGESPFVDGMRNLTINILSFVDMVGGIEAAKEAVKLLLPIREHLDDYKEAYAAEINRYMADHATVSIEDIREYTTSEDGKGTSILLDCLRKVIEHGENTPPIIIPQRIKEIIYPVDKANSVIWNMLDIPQGETVPIKVEADACAEQLTLLYSIEFDAPGLQISSALEPYDKRVHIAIASLFAHGYKTITIGMIYNAMGYDGNPGTSDIERIDAALTKMTRAIVTLDNKEEAKVYNYPHFRYKGSLLPLERVDRLINGNVVESAIHLLREPPLQQFARERVQITTIPRKVIQSPLNKTNANLAIEDYLILRISHAKKGKSPRKMLYSTIFSHTNMTTKKQRHDAKNKIDRLMEHYKATGFIAGYETGSDGVTVTLSANHAKGKS